MTEDQKDNSLLLDLLLATRKVPRTAAWLADEMRLAGRPRRDVDGLLRGLRRMKLVQSTEDSLGVERWSITDEGRDALEEL